MRTFDSAEALKGANMETNLCVWLDHIIGAEFVIENRKNYKVLQLAITNKQGN